MTNEPKPCRGCGEDTTARAEGVPYCSMSCIGARRKEVRMETYYCPKPGCDWSHEYDPDRKLQVAEFDAKVRHHAETEHGLEVNPVA